MKMLLNICLIIFGIILFAAIPQKTVAQGNENQSSVIYLNGFGSSLTYALTYDTRFGDRQNGLGGSIGFGAYALQGDYFFNVPVQINYLFGEELHFFEIGAGAVFHSSNQKWMLVGLRNQKTYNLVGSLNFMYRLQMSKGFFLRVGWTPIFGKFYPIDYQDNYGPLSQNAYFGIWPAWFGIGLGYCIK